MKKTELRLQNFDFNTTSNLANPTGNADNLVSKTHQ